MKTTYLGFSGTDIKQAFMVSEWDGINFVKGSSKSVLIGINNQLLRIRYPKGTKSGIKYLKNATNDLKSLAALAITGLVPLGIFADKLQEEFPEHEQAANILREFGEIRWNGKN